MGAAAESPTTRSPARVKLLISIFNLVRNSWSIVARGLRDFFLLLDSAQLHNHHFLSIRPMKCYRNEAKMFIFPKRFSGILLRRVCSANVVSSKFSLNSDLLQCVSVEVILFMLHETKAKISDYVEKSLVANWKILGACSSSDALIIFAEMGKKEEQEDEARVENISSMFIEKASAFVARIFHISFADVLHWHEMLSACRSWML